jgi:O-antigen/teichoic acid export membrane protein
MRASRRIIKNMFSLTLAEFANKGITLIAFAYLARAITPDGFGIIGYASSIIAYFTMFVGLGFDTVGAREIAQDKLNFKKYVDSIITIRTILSVIAIIILFLFTYFLNKPITVKYVILITGINILSNAFLLNWFYIGIEKMEIIAVRQVISSILNLIGIILLVRDFSDTLIASLILAATMAINTAWMLIYYCKNQGLIKFTIDWPLWKSLFKSSIFIGLTFFIVIIYNNLNMTMLGFMRPFSETGIYNAAYKVILIAILPASIIQNSFFPNLSRLESIEERLRYTKKYSMLIFLSGTFISFSFFVFANNIIPIVYGNKYNQSIDILRILMITCILMHLSVSYSSALIAWKKEKEVMVAIALGGIVNVILNFLLIPKYGVYGAAISTISCEFVVIIGVGYLYYRTIKILYLKELLKFIFISGIACGIGYLLLFLGINVIISSFCCIGIYIAINLLFKTFTIQELRGYITK